MDRAKKTFGRMRKDLKNQGGYSTNVRTGESPTSGWMVAKYGHEKKIPIPASQKDIEKYHGKESKALHKQGFSGGWRDTDKGNDVLDAVRRYKQGPGGFLKASRAMVREQQDSIYSPKTNQEYTSRERSGKSYPDFLASPKGQVNQQINTAWAQARLKKKFPGKYGDSDFPSP